jgi:hypothetical protein
MRVTDRSTYACAYCEHTSVGAKTAEKHVDESHPEKVSQTASGGRVRNLGHLEVPESEQTWEIHLRPKPSPESQNQPPDDRAHTQAEDSVD